MSRGGTSPITMAAGSMIRYTGGSGSPGEFGHRHGWLGGATTTTSAGHLYRRTCAGVPKGSDTGRQRRSDGGRLNSVSLKHAT